MSKTFREIVKLDPSLKDDALVESTADEYDRLSAMRSLANSRGGKALIGNIERSACDLISSIIQGYQTIPHIELVCLIARLDSDLGKLVEISGKGTFESLESTVEEYLSKK